MQLLNSVAVEVNAIVFDYAEPSPSIGDNELTKRRVSIFEVILESDDICGIGELVLVIDDHTIGSKLADITRHEHERTFAPWLLAREGNDFQTGDVEQGRASPGHSLPGLQAHYWLSNEVTLQ